MLSLVCSVEISRFSHRFRQVLRTLGAVNQISTDGQVSAKGENRERGWGGVDQGGRRRIESESCSETPRAALVTAADIVRSSGKKVDVTYAAVALFAPLRRMHEGRKRHNTGAAGCRARCALQPTWNERRLSRSHAWRKSPPPPSAVPLLRLPAAPDSTVNPATVCRCPEQVNRIVRITVTGNVFFAIRAACELTVGWALYKHYQRELLSCTKAVSDGLRKRIDGGSVGTGSNCLR